MYKDHAICGHWIDFCAMHSDSFVGMAAVRIHPIAGSDSPDIRLYSDCMLMCTRATVFNGLGISIGNALVLSCIHVFVYVHMFSTGDFSLAQQSRYIAALPGLSQSIIDKNLSPLNLTAAEERMAKEPGLQGRIWHGQGMVFDEGYGILMLLGILTNPKEAWPFRVHHIYMLYVGASSVPITAGFLYLHHAIEGGFLLVLVLDRCMWTGRQRYRQVQRSKPPAGVV